MTKISLRRKTLVVISLTLLVLIGVIYLASIFTVQKGFNQLESDYAVQDTQRAKAALEAEIKRLAINSRDWAGWDDTLAFVKGELPDYPEVNLQDDFLINLSVNYMVFLDTEGVLVYSKGLDLESGEPLDFSQEMIDSLNRNGILSSITEPDQMVSGLFVFPNGPAIVAMHPILTSQLEGPAGGILIMVRLLDSALIQSIGETTQLSTSVFGVNQIDSAAPTAIQNAYTDLLASSKDQAITRVKNLQTIYGFTLLRDIEDRPAAVLQVELPRHIYNQGQSSISSFLIALIGATIIFGAVSLLVLERTILARLAGMNRVVSEISKTGDLARRLNIRGSDEISDLSGQINNMLASLESSEHRMSLLVEDAKKAQESAENANQVKTEFLSNMSDEFRTPLHETINRLQAIKAGSNLTDEQRTHIEKTEAKIHDLLAMVDYLLTYATLGSKQESP